MTVTADLGASVYTNAELPSDLKVQLNELCAAYFRHIELGESDDSSFSELASDLSPDRLLVPEGGVGDAATEVAATLVRAHLTLASQRAADTPRVRVRPAEGPPAGGSSATVGPVVLIVTDDMPMLVESVTAAINNLGAGICEVVHPVFSVRREADGTLIDVEVTGGRHRAGSVAESWMHVQLQYDTPDEVIAAVERAVPQVLADVRQVVADTDGMIRAERSLADELDTLATGPTSRYSADDLRDCAQLLRWFADGHYTILGYQRYEVRDGRLEADEQTALGILRPSIASIDAVAGNGNSERIDQLFATPTEPLLVFAQGRAPITVQRSGYPHYVAVHTLDDAGHVVAEHRFVGVFTVTALHEDVLDIPVVARRVRAAIADSGNEIASFTGQAMLEVIQAFPRTELFATDTESLRRTIATVHSVASRRQVRLFVRADPWGSYVSALVYLPRDRYTTRVRLDIQRILEREFGGASVEYSARVTESALALLHCYVRMPISDSVPDIDVSEENRVRIEALVASATRTWDDALHEAAGDRALSDGYAAAFPTSYKQDFDANRAVADIAIVDGLQHGSIEQRIYGRENADGTGLRFTLYIGGHSVSLSRVLPVLHSMGVEVLDERPYMVTRPDGLVSWIYDFGLTAETVTTTHAFEGETDAQAGTRFTDAFEAAWSGQAEVDRFNELVLTAGLTWREAAIVRAYAKYLRQAGFAYSQSRIESVLHANVPATRDLVELFTVLFDPAAYDDARAAEVEKAIAEKIDAVVSLEADRILRAYLGLIKATLRTNYFVWRDQNSEFRGKVLSFKLDPGQIAELPKPRPHFEIFVYSPRVEGVHLRFGSVARGGLRWSDRLEDFRTEILGLVKAQAVKNAVIVPVGAKGGFVVKHPPAATGDAAADRDAYREEGVACYRMFVGGLLDITDNRDSAGEVLPPENVIRRDGDDPYLVVAADKGTATFSDIANDVAHTYHFWLGDAFASGGSIGYDHKAMAITARGAWESVKRHFREIDVDTQTQDFTVAGIGDMSGDVFGNGMLLSKHIRLVAAFDHRHIFLDPNPNIETTFAERERLFALSRSSWADYDTSLISEGGGIFSRELKSIPLTPQVREVLGLADGVVSLTPTELVRAILLAPVDLLWNGGIGTYVKASTESHAQVGDKANDALRVDGNQVRARVIGEGGNLGATSLGRIEFDLAGGRINTDAMDNSAGVDCSDHEVNIKILLDSVVKSGALTAEDRNALLPTMTDEVAALVLANNRSQNEVLGQSRADAPELLPVHASQIRSMVANRGLDRELEALPGGKEIERRREAGLGLTSPELCTLMAHVKLNLKADLIPSDVLDAEAFTRMLVEYFPRKLQETYREAILTHPLRRELTATVVVNDVVDNGGITYAFRLSEETGVTTIDAVRAFVAVQEIFGLSALWKDIAAAGLSTEVSDAMTMVSRRLLDRSARWFLTNRPQPVAIGAEISRFADGVGSLLPLVADLLTGTDAEKQQVEQQQLRDQGVPAELAQRISTMLDSFALLDIVELADITDRPLREVAELYYALNERLKIDRVLVAITKLPRSDRWDALARLALRDDIYGAMRALCLDVLALAEPEESADEMISEWEMHTSSRLARARVTLNEIFDSESPTLATLSVAARQLRSVIRGVSGDRSH